MEITVLFIDCKVRAFQFLRLGMVDKYYQLMKSKHNIYMTAIWSMAVKGANWGSFTSWLIIRSCRFETNRCPQKTYHEETCADKGET